MKNNKQDEFWQDEVFTDSDSTTHSDSVSPDDDDEDAMSEDVTQSSLDIEPSDSAFLDRLIVRLMAARQPRVRTGSRRVTRAASLGLSTIPVDLKYEELAKLCELACDSFRQQKSLIRLKRSDLPIVICADIHGQFRDLRDIFHKCGAPFKQNYLFLGDYVDRGAQGIPTLSLLLALKIKYYNKVFLLRGNHESSQTTLSYGFYDECMMQFVHSEDNQGESIWKKFIEVFNWMPFAAVIDSTIFCVHGGLSPELESLESVEQIKRPCVIPAFGLACDLVWSDPKDWTQEGWTMSSRGISLYFSRSVIDAFCERCKIDLILRGHQLANSSEEMMKNGYKFFAGGRLITLFSARNYMNTGNAAAVVRLSEELNVEFVVFRVRREKRRRATERKTYATSIDAPRIDLGDLAM